MNQLKNDRKRTTGTAVRTAVPPALTEGTVLVRPGVALPPFAKPFLKPGVHWDVLSGIDARDMGLESRQEGWHFFHVVPEVVVRAASMRRQQAIDKALRRVVDAVEAQRVNAFEISNIQLSRVLGMWFVKIAAQPRHVRPVPSAFDLKLNRWADWKPPSYDPPMSVPESAGSKAA